jgi:hypothetical protein
MQAEGVLAGMSVLEGTLTAAGVIKTQVKPLPAVFILLTHW